VCEGRSVLLLLLLLLLLLIADALRRCKWLFQCCGHLQCEEWFVDHCLPQRPSI
jgi:hypothetical protein